MEMDMVLAISKKGKKHLTNILDPYPEALMSEEPIYSDLKTKIYKIEDKSGEYILKAKDIKAEDIDDLMLVQNEYVSTKKLGSEHPHFIKTVSIRYIDYPYNNEQMTRIEVLLEYGGPDLAILMKIATDKEITMWMLQSLSALLYSEKQKISHFDIKPRNMVYRNGLLKIIDMGTAIEFSQTTTFYKPVGHKRDLIGCTPDYAPPELINGIFDQSSIICGKVDAYCWAMSLYQIICNIKNFNGIRIVDKGEEEYNKFLEDIRNNSELAKFDKKKIVTQVIIGCLKYKPEDRLNFENVQELLNDMVDEEYEDIEKAKSLYYSIGCSYLENTNNKSIAFKYFIKEINIYRKTLSNAKLFEKYDSNNIGSAYNEIGNVHYYNGEYKDALIYYQKALNIEKKIFGEEHLSTALTYYNIGSTNYSMGEYKNTLNKYEMALNIRKKFLGEEHTDTANTYYGIGFTYYNMGEFKKAIINYENALKIRKKVLGDEHPDTATTYYNIAFISNMIGEFKNALKNYENALNIRKKLLGEDCSDIAAIYNNIGVTYDNMRDYKNALINYEKALNIRKKIMGEEHSLTAKAYDNIGDAYDNMGEYKNAIINYVKALSIREKIFGEENIETAMTYNNIGSTYNNMGEYKNALINFEKALNIKMKVLGEESSSTADTFGNIGNTYYNMGEYKDAQINYEKALSIKKKVLGEKHSSTIATYNEIQRMSKEKNSGNKQTYICRVFNILKKALNKIANL